MCARIDTNMYGVRKQTCYAVVQNFTFVVQFQPTLQCPRKTGIT